MDYTPVFLVLLTRDIWACLMKTLGPNVTKRDRGTAVLLP